MRSDDIFFADFLLDMGLASRPQLAEALSQAEEEGRTLSEVLARASVAGEDDLRRARALWLGMPFARIGASDISADALQLIPEPVCRAHSLFAFSLESRILHVAFLNSEDIAALEALRLPYTLRPYLTDAPSLRLTLLRYQRLLKDRFTLDVDGLLLRALAQQASEVHIEPSAPLQQGGQALVRYRVAGSLRDAYALPQAVAVQAAGQLKSLAKLSLDAAAPQHGRFKIMPDNSPNLPDASPEITVHVSSLPVDGGDAITLRLAPPGAGGYSLEQMGLHGEGLEGVHRMLAAPSGLVLVCGAAENEVGEMLRTMLAYVADPTRRLVVLGGQDSEIVPFATRVADSADVSRATLARAALRQNPDVFMVSRLVDAETAALALMAANRGMLVLLGMDAPSTSQALAELVHEYGVSSTALAAVFMGAVSVRSARRLCPHTQALYRPLRPEISLLEKNGLDFVRVLQTLKEERVIRPDLGWKDIPFWSPEQCALCQGGYQGRVGLQEVLPASMAIRELLKQGAPAEALAGQWRAEGSLSLAEDALCKAAQKTVTFEAVAALAVEPAAIV